MTNVTSVSSSQEVQSLKNDIHDLENELQTSRNRQDKWNGWYLRLGVAALVVAAFLGIASWVCQKKASRIEYDSRPAADKLASKNAQLREVLAEGFRVDIARANEGAVQAQVEVAKANRAAADANRIAESEKLARLQLEARLADRVLSEAQQKSIADFIRPSGPCVVQVYWYSDVTEVSRLKDAVINTLVAAGWKVGAASAQGGVTVTGGLVLAIRRNASVAEITAANRLIFALRKNGVFATMATLTIEDIPGPGLSFGTAVPNPQIMILIGNKPS